DDGSSSSQNQQNQQSQQNQSSTDLTKQEFDVAWQDALDDARDEFDGDVNKIELEPNDAGNYVYKIRSEEHTSELQSRFELVCQHALPSFFAYTTLLRCR